MNKRSKRTTVRLSLEEQREFVSGKRRCPVDGGRLTLRDRLTTDEDTGKVRFRGSYWGCENYHTCRFYMSFEGSVPITWEGE